MNNKPFGFTDSRWGNSVYIWPQVTTYASNGNTAIQFWCNPDGFDELWATVTTNLGEPLPKELVAIKDYAENEALAEMLIKANIIVPEPVGATQSGFVIIHTYRLTEAFIKEFLA